MNAAERLSELSRSYQNAAVLLTAARLDVFAAIGREARPANEIAATTGVDADGLERVLLALVVDGVLQKDGEAFRIAPEFVEILLPDGTDSQAFMLKHQHSVMQRWARLDEVLRTGEPLARQERGEDEMRNFICGMADISRKSSEDVADALDLSGCTKMLDLGGGPATASITFAKKYPGLHPVVLDLEGPLGIAREEIEKAGLSDRVTTRVGDMLEDDYGAGYDLVYISNVIHMVGPEATGRILRGAHECLVPGGMLVLKDFFMEDDRLTPGFATFFSINMLVGTQDGKSYTRTETEALLTEAGFSGFEMKEVATTSRLLIAHKC